MINDALFETERLYVRHLMPDDLDDLAALCADPIAMQYMGDGKPLDRATCERWIGICQEKYADRGYGTSAVIEKNTDQFVGFCGVIRAPENDYDEIIYAFSQPSWGKGYATEAAKAMLFYVFMISDLETIYATIHEKNTVSQEMMSKLGLAFIEDRPNEDSDHLTKVYAIQRTETS